MDYRDGPPDDDEQDWDDASRISVSAWDRIDHLIKVGQLDRARELAAQQVSRDPDDTGALIGMARVQIALKQWEDALSTLKAVMALDPELSDAFYFQAYARRQLGHFADSEEAIRAAISLDPDWAGYRTEYAYLLGNCGLYSEALVQTNAALQIDAEDGDALTYRSTLLALVPKKDIDLSEDSAQRAVELDPEDAEAHAALGFARLMGGRTEEAQHSCRAALEIDPTNVLALRGLTEATAASSFLYRPMFRFGLWLDRLGDGGGFTVIFGLWAVINAITGFLRSGGAVELAHYISLIYLGFCVYTWFSRPITMFLLKLKHPWLRDCDV